MSSNDRGAMLQRFVNGVNEGNFDVIDELLTTEFFSYSPYPGEPTAPEAFREFAEELHSGAPDYHIRMYDVVEEDNQIRGCMELTGTYSGIFWGLPGSGKSFAVDSTFFARFDGPRMALRWEGFNMMGLLVDIGLVPPPEKRHLPAPESMHTPEIVFRLLFNGMQLEEKPCSHLDMIQVTEPTTDVCEQCVASGDEWPALRMCLICGFVGCCDTSVNKHTKKHCEETGHAIIRSIQPGEGWIWCYEDNALLSSRHLRR